MASTNFINRIPDGDGDLQNCPKVNLKLKKTDYERLIRVAISKGYSPKKGSKNGIAEFMRRIIVQALDDSERPSCDLNRVD